MGKNNWKLNYCNTGPRYRQAEYHLTTPQGMVLAKIIAEEPGLLVVKKGNSIKAEFASDALDSAKLYAEKWCV